MRLVSPSLLLLTLIALPLPWLNIKCDTPPEFKSELGAAKDVSVTLVTQNGIQTLTGGYSPGPTFAAMESAAKRERNNVSGPATPNDQPRQGLGRLMGGSSSGTQESVSPAVLVFGWLALVAVGALVGFCGANSAGRTAVLTATSAIAAACLLLQAFVVQFPLARAVDKDLQADQQMRQQMGGGNQVGQKELIRTTFGFGFWLAFVGCLSAGATAVLAPRKASRPSRSFEDEPPPQPQSRPALAGTDVIQYSCPECGSALQARREVAGMTIKCSACQSMIAVPRP